MTYVLHVFDFIFLCVHVIFFHSVFHKKDSDRIHAFDIYIDNEFFLSMFHVTKI